MEPVRTCVGCRQRTVSSELLRVTVVSGSLEPDPTATRTGRGAWLHSNQQCLKLALDRKAFGRALKVTSALQTAALTKYVEQAETMLATK